jgi:hypothetical protein
VTYRITNEDEVISLTKENAIAFRRCLGVEAKDRTRVHVSIEKDLLQAFDQGDRKRGDLSDLINQGLNLMLIKYGFL